LGKNDEFNCFDGLLIIAFCIFFVQARVAIFGYYAVFNFYLKEVGAKIIYFYIYVYRLLNQEN